MLAFPEAPAVCSSEPVHFLKISCACYVQSGFYRTSPAEEGSVAVAASEIELEEADGPPSRWTLTVDWPFGLLLCDRRTAAVIFAGVVYKP